MRSVYLQFGENLPRFHQAQVQRLNTLVLQYAVPNVLSNVKQYMSYLNNVDKNPIPLSHPEYISNTGLKACNNLKKKKREYTLIFYNILEKKIIMFHI